MSIVIAFPDYITTTGLGGGNLSGGSWSATFPAANLVTSTQLSPPARTTNAVPSSTVLNVSFPGVVPITSVGMIGVNLSKQALLRVILFSDAAFTTQIAILDWFSAFPGWANAATIPWGYPSVYDRISGDNTFFTNRRDVIVDFGKTYAAQSMSIQVSDANNTDGYFQIGRLFASASWRPSINAIYGLSLQYEDASLIQTAFSGAEYATKKFKRRVVKFTLDKLPEAEMRYWTNELHNRQGVTDQVLFIKDTTQSSLTPDSFLGRLRSLSPLESAAYGAASEAFEIAEVL